MYLSQLKHVPLPNVQLVDIGTKVSNGLGLVGIHLGAEVNTSLVTVFVLVFQGNGSDHGSEDALKCLHGVPDLENQRIDRVLVHGVSVSILFPGWKITEALGEGLGIAELLVLAPDVDFVAGVDVAGTEGIFEGSEVVVHDGLRDVWLT